MKRWLIFSLALFACAGAAGMSLAQSAAPAQQGVAMPEVCLQFNRLQRWSIVNARTLEITDKTEKKYRVVMNDTCAHSSFISKVVINRLGKSGLSCVEPGDRINLSMKNAPVERCLIREVSLYTDAQRELDKKVEPAKP